MSEMWRRFQDLVGVQYPIVQDGMGPSPTTKLAAAVSNAGALGTVTSPSITSGDEKFLREKLREACEDVASNTDGNYAINVPVGRVATGEMLLVSKTCIDEATKIKKDGGKTGEQLVALTTSAGFPGEFVSAIKGSGLVHIQKCGSVKHAKKAAEAGVDVIIASGAEMGGHTHLVPVHTMVLAPQVIDALDLPVLVSGGIADGRGLAAVMAMGAAGAAMGTRFIATQEHEWHQNYKQRIVDTPEWGDCLLPGVYGALRGLKNSLVDRIPEVQAKLTDDEFNAWKEAQTRVSQFDGDVENGLLLAGQVAAAVHDIPTVKELIDRIVTQAGQLLAQANSIGLGAAVNA